MVELKPLALLAPPAVLAYECALRSVALPDRAPDTRRDVARIPSGRIAATRPARFGELLLLDLANPGVECVLEDPAQVAGRHFEPEQVLQVAKSLVTAPAHAEVNLVSLGRERFHN